MGVLLAPRESCHLQQRFALHGLIVHPPVIHDDIQPAGLACDPAPRPKSQGTQSQPIRLLQWTVYSKLQAEFNGPVLAPGDGQQPGQRVFPGGHRETGLHR